MFFAHGGELELIDFDNPKHTVINLVATLGVGLVAAVFIAFLTKRQGKRLSLANWIIIILGVAGVAYFILAEGQTREKAPVAIGQIQQEASAFVELTDSGYNPGEVTVKSGQNVKWINKSNFPMWVASDPHPSHNGLPGFDQGRILHKGESYSFTFIKVGQFGYHDHLNPGRRGKVIVTPQ